MYDHLITAQLAVRSTHLLADSALPDAPVVAPRAGGRLQVRARARVATLLHRAASALEPSPRREHVTGPVGQY
jgi:hypothetical protein